MKIGTEFLCILRLVTTKDVGMTLMDLANMTFIDTTKKGYVTSLGVAKEEEAVAGASLLQNVHSTWRSCDDADIPPQWCLCMDEKTLQSDDYT
ncbi:hypothetical protein GCK32_016795, partial [Trichostrongylus colubriformis]